MGSLLGRDGGACIYGILGLGLVLLIFALLYIILILEEGQWPQGRLDGLREPTQETSMMVLGLLTLLHTAGMYT